MKESIKHLLIFVIIVCALLLCMPHIHMFKKTVSGKSYGYFKTETSTYLPPILARYLSDAGVHYSLYKLPNYVVDFLTFNNDFSAVYKSKPKFTIIVFLPEQNPTENYTNIKLLYDKLQSLIKFYNKDFNMIVREEWRTTRYIQGYERDAYKDLKSYCGNFCIIDPTGGMMFVFRKISFTEVEALEAVLQHYSYMYNK